MLYQEVVVPGNACKEITKVAYRTTTCLKLLEENNYNVIDAFNLRNEGGSFVSKGHIRDHLPSVMNFLKMCVTIDSNVKHTKYCVV